MRCTVLHLLLFFAVMQNAYSQTPNDTLVLTIKAVSGMQYDLVRFKVEPGRYIKLILKNADEMEHNLVVGKKGSREKIIAEALALGEKGPGLGFIPAIAETITSIRLLRAGEQDSTIFRAPRTTGVYPYVCTFPGHGAVMYGAMHVTNGVLPKLEADDHIPLHRRVNEEHRDMSAKVPDHPYELKPPYHYRVLMPDAGPAAIAVSLPKEINYCWDAGACRLRYAWIGEFLDMKDYWTVKGELNAKILGTIFYRSGDIFPFKLDEGSEGQIQFKGYRLLDGYPEFHYRLDGVDIYELILPVEEGFGLQRKFRIEGLSTDIYFSLDKPEGIIITANKGQLRANQIKFTPDEASEFTVTMKHVDE